MVRVGRRKWHPYRWKVEWCIADIKDCRMHFRAKKRDTYTRTSHRQPHLFKRNWSRPWYRTSLHTFCVRSTRSLFLAHTEVMHASRCCFLPSGYNFFSLWTQPGLQLRIVYIAKQYIYKEQVLSPSVNISRFFFLLILFAYIQLRFVQIKQCERGKNQLIQLLVIFWTFHCSRCSTCFLCYVVRCRTDGKYREKETQCIELYCVYCGFFVVDLLFFWGIFIYSLKINFNIEFSTYFGSY